MNLRCVIIDDEGLAREGLQILLSRCHAFDVTVVGEGSCARDFVDLATSLKPDVAFLDINMPGKSGFDAIRSLDAQDMPFIVFVTAHAEFALQGFDFDATDYLLKPVSEKRLSATLHRVSEKVEAKDAVSQARKTRTLIQSIGVRNSLGPDNFPNGKFQPQPAPGSLTVRDTGRLVRVDADEVVCIQAARDYMCVTTVAESYVSRTTMKQLVSILDPERFYRIHRSTLVNVHHTRAINSLGHCRFELIMSDGKILRSSKNFRSAVRNIVEVLDG